MAESFFEKRKRELGMTTQSTKVGSSSGDSSFFERRKQELGLTPVAIKEPAKIETRTSTPIDKPKTTVLNDIVYGGTNKLLSKGKEPAAEIKTNAITKIKEQKDSLDRMSSASTSSSRKWLDERDAIETAAKYGMTVEELAKTRATNEAKYKPEFENIARMDAQVENSRNIPFIGEALQRLDNMKANTKGFSDVSLSLYTPAAGLSMINAATKGVGGLVSRIAPRIGNSDGLGATIARRAIEEGVTGAPLGVGNVLARNPQASNAEIAEGAAWGAGGGAVLGAGIPAAGAGFKSVLSKYASKAKDPAVIERILALPAPRVRGNVNGVDTPSVIYDADTRPNGLPEPHQRTLNELRSADEARVEIASIDDEIRNLNSRYEQAINDEYQFLQNSLKERGGVRQGFMTMDGEGSVNGRVGRMSDNPQWYRDFYAANGKVPNRKELYNLAKKHIDEGHQEDDIFVPAWKTENNYDEVIEALNQVKQTLELSSQVNPQKGIPANLVERVGRASGNPTPIRTPVQEAPVRSVQPTNSATSVRTPEPIVNAPRAVEQPVKPKAMSEVDSQIARLDGELKTYKEIINIQINSGAIGREQAAKQIKGRSMEIAAQKRAIIQGDSLIPVEGGLTGKELQNKIDRLRTNYQGKEVIAGGREGKVKGNSFGKVVVEYPDGTTKSFLPEDVTPKSDIDALIKRQSEAKAANAPKEVPVTRAEQPTPAASKQVDPPKQAPKVEPRTSTQGAEKERGFATTLRESDKTPQTFKEKLKSAFTSITNEESLANANRRMRNVEEAASYAMGSSRFTAEKAATAQRLIDHFNKTRNFQRAVDIAEKVAEEATNAGQSIQALSMFNQLTPEGVLIKAQRLAAKTNERLLLGQAEVKVTEKMAENISDLAQTTQKMTGVKDLANNIENILDKAKSGAKLTKTETDELKRFVTESKQFINEVSKPPKAPRAPQVPKDSRVKENVVKFLDSHEQAARERLRARGIRMSSTPLDVWADYAIIGAAKMGKGTIKFADWSAEMVKDFGEEIKPHLHNLYDRSRQTFNLSAQKVTKQTISDAEKIVERAIKSNEKLTATEIKNMRELAQNVSRLSGEEKNLASQDLQVIMQTLSKPTFLRKVATTQTIGQLLNPKTLVRNSIGNELFYRLERFTKTVTTPLDIARSKITGTDRKVTFRTNNQGEYWKNWMRGLKAGWRGTNVNGIETQYDLGGPSFKSKYNPLLYLEKVLGASLKSFDTAAYMRAYNNTLGEQATLRAINEGQKGNKELIRKYIREADDNIMKIADEYGRYSTFQDNNAISKGLVALKKGMNLKKDFGVGDLILKYPKTPGALLHRALEYSPAGFLRSAAILSRPLLKKEPNTAEAMNALGRAIVGTAGLTGMGFFLFEKGVLTGSVSKDRDIRDLQKSTGQGQYQVNLSALTRLVKSGFNAESAKLQENDFLYTYDWMQPLSMAISIGANTSKNMNAGEQKLSGLAGTVYNSVEGGLGTLTEQSVVQGLKRAAEGYPGQTFTDKVMDVLSDIPASFVPTFSNQLKQLGDNNKPETYDPSKLQQSLNRAQAKIPGLAQKLPIQYDTLGRKKETYQDNNLFNVMFNPGFSSRYKLTPEEEYIIDLIEETGDESLAPRAPGKKITVKGESFILNGDQYSRLQQLQGEETRERIERKSRLDVGKGLNRRSKNITNALTDAGAAAKKTLSKEMGLR